MTVPSFEKNFRDRPQAVLYTDNQISRRLKTNEIRQTIGTALIAFAFLGIGTVGLVNGIEYGNIFTIVAGSASDISGAVTLVSAFRPRKTFPN